jgi:transposase-like protein
MVPGEDRWPPEPGLERSLKAHAAAIRGYNKEHSTVIIIRQVKSRNNWVVQDHRAVKRATRPMLGFNAFDAAPWTLAGVEFMHMLQKAQREGGAEQGLTPPAQFYALAASSPNKQASRRPR